MLALEQFHSYGTFKAEKRLRHFLLKNQMRIVVGPASRG